MCYDARHLLHYFRLMPDRCFFFAMRAGVLPGAYFEAKAQGELRRNFERMFPAWAAVETTHAWSGMVSLARHKLPIATPLPWVAMCYHGNGVAIGSYAGRMIADVVMGRDDGFLPERMRVPLTRFPFGRARQIIMPPLYAALKLLNVIAN